MRCRSGKTRWGTQMKRGLSPSVDERWGSDQKLYTSPPISRRIDQRSAVTWNLKAISKVVDATNTLRPQRLSARRCWEYFSVRQVLKVRHAKLKEIRAALVAGGRDGLD